MSNQYRKKPVVINAFRLGYDNMPDWFMDKLTANDVTIHNTDGRWRGGPDYALIKTLEGEMRAEFGDYIIQGVKGELYPCKPDIFATTYESAATVAEPSKTATQGDETMPKRGTLAWLIRLLQQLQVAGTASEAKVYINDPTFGRVEVGGALYGLADVELTPNDDDEEAAQQQAEPESVIMRQAQKIGELIAERDSWIEAHARLYRLYHDQSPKAGEEIHVNVEGGDVYTLPLQLSGMDKPRFVVHVPCSPQAEPGADETDLWTLIEQYAMAVSEFDLCVYRSVDSETAENERDVLRKRLKARAAQSGQRGAPEQILAERNLTCEAIEGAIAFGYQNTNPPPSDDHWLAPFWKIGRKQAQLEQSGQRAGVVEGWRLVPEKPTYEQLAAADRAWRGDPLKRSSTLYCAMIAAAPTQQEG